MRMHLFAVIFLLVSCKPDGSKVTPLEYSENSKKRELVFGVHPHLNPGKLHKVYAPLIKILNKEFAKIGSNISVRIEASRDYLDFEKKIADGTFHFSLLNPYQALSSLEYGYKVFAKMDGQRKTKGLFLVRKDSNINKMEDLIGKRVCFSAPTGFATAILPKSFLSKNGVNLKKDIKISYLGSHKSVIMGVYNKTCDVSATCPLTWDIHKEENQELSNELKVLWETQNSLSNGLVHRTNLSPDIVSTLKKTLNNLHQSYEGKNVIKNLNIKRFQSAENSTYKEVTQFLSIVPHRGTKNLKGSL